MKVLKWANGRLREKVKVKDEQIRQLNE